MLMTYPVTSHYKKRKNIRHFLQSLLQTGTLMFIKLVLCLAQLMGHINTASLWSKLFLEWLLTNWFYTISHWLVQLNY